MRLILLMKPFPGSPAQPQQGWASFPVDRHNPAFEPGWLAFGALALFNLRHPGPVFVRVAEVTFVTTFSLTLLLLLIRTFRKSRGNRLFDGRATSLERFVPSQASGSLAARGTLDPVGVIDTMSARSPAGRKAERIPQVASGDRTCLIIGAGPAGLTAAYYFASRWPRVLVVERDRQVGGLARTVEYKGFKFDIGGHRFYTKAREVQALWREMLGADFLRRPRLSRIYYRGKFFDYPLRPWNALTGLGVKEAVFVVASYGWARLRPTRPEASFEDWVSNRFGPRLCRIFFKTYTEKVWGISCRQIGAHWAAQRIKGLSLSVAILNMLRPRWLRSKGPVKTLIDEFEYPRFGPGMMWERFRQRVEERGVVVELGTSVVRLAHHDGEVTDVTVAHGGSTRTIPVELVLSTMPLRELVLALDPPSPPEVRAAADRLHYRDFIVVALIIDKPFVFPDTWIYVHDPEVRLGRIQNFKNWSPDMVPDQSKTCLGLEYFCSTGDDLWSMPDDELIRLGQRDLAAIGLASPGEIVDGTVVRMLKAYPVYDEGFTEAVDSIRHYLAGFSNLQVAGRNGMHKYNNQDHSMVTALLAARNLLGETLDAWAVNADDEYLEEYTELEQQLRQILLTQPTTPVFPSRSTVS